MTSIVVHEPPPDSPRESTSYAPSEPLSTSPLNGGRDYHPGERTTARSVDSADEGRLRVPGDASRTGADGDQPGEVGENGAGGGHGRPRSASAVTTRDTTILNPDHPPPLNFTFKLKNPLLYFAFLVLCNVVIPVLLYYPVRATTDLSDKELIGIGSAALGLSSCFDAPFRMWKLTRHRAKYGPLYYPYAPDPAHQPAQKRWLPQNMPRSWWHLDFFMWVYQFGLFVFAVPLAIAPSIPLYNFFLFSFAMLVIPIGIIFALTLKSWKNLPFWMSSDPPRTSTKPAVYYFIEDVGAVDFGHGREWRKRCQARYAASPPFRALMWSQTLFWTVAMVIFVGLTAVVDWVSSLNVAFGVVISLIFMWGIFFGIISYIMVHFALKKELAWWRAEYAGLVEEHHGPPSIRAPSSGPNNGLQVPPSLAGAGEETDAEKREREFLGAQGLSKPGKVAKGRHRGYSVHAVLAPTPEPSIRGGVEGGGLAAPEMVQVPSAAGSTRTTGSARSGAVVKDTAGRTVAAAEGGEGVPEKIAEGEKGEAREKVEKDFAVERPADAEKEGVNGSPV
ncbi:hypothetical protein JCM6882_000558 [Rhodosporidiobolus microsporus]